MSPGDLVFAGLAALAAGIINALAGGGTLISFPVLLALGVPPVTANVTNTVALVPAGFFAPFVIEADPRPPFIARADPAILPTVAPAPAPTLPSATGPPRAARAAR